MNKWFFPAQAVIEKYLTDKYEDWSSVRQTVTKDVVYESYQVGLKSGGTNMIQFVITKPPRAAAPGVIMMFVNTGGEHLQYHQPEKSSIRTKNQW